MKTIVSINGGNVGSTGRIVRGISALARKQGFETIAAYPKSRNLLPVEESDYIISSVPVKFLSTRAAYITGFNGCFAWFSTMRFLHALKRINPDILHFHNLHDSYINLGMLFKYVKKHRVRVIWTLHDCWSFTGGCAHFAYNKCAKWKNGCGKCNHHSSYPSSLVDKSRWLWKKKRKWFAGVDDLTIVTPSEWLSNLVSESFLNCYPVKVINNGIDLDIFKPTSSGFREKHNIATNEILLLGVAYNWGSKKGLDVFVELSHRLPNKYRIVLVGTNESVEEQLPNSIICIRKTNSQKELAEIYTAADIFVNPTREDTFPTVNIEALACGSPVITFDAGGSAEMINDDCGCVVPDGNVDALEKAIIRISSTHPFSEKACIRKGHEYSCEERYKDYVSLYNVNTRPERMLS